MAQYADIIEIVAPSQTAQGSRVDITVKIKNIYSAAIVKQKNNHRET